MTQAPSMWDEMSDADRIAFQRIEDEERSANEGVEKLRALFAEQARIAAEREKWEQFRRRHPVFAAFLEAAAVAGMSMLRK